MKYYTYRGLRDRALRATAVVPGRIAPIHPPSGPVGRLLRKAPFL